MKSGTETRATVADIIGDLPTVAEAKRIEPPRLEGQLQFPEPGIYFGMPEETYHATHSASASGLKKLNVSSMDYWANSPLNPEREDDNDTVAKAMGRAYHCRICEGHDAFMSRFGVGLEKGDYEDLIVTTADLRAAIETYDVKPKGTAKGPLIEQLLELDPEAKVWDLLVEENAKANEGKAIITPKLYRRIEIANAMIERDPQLKGAFAGGHAEVSVFWYDEATGAPMKARFDYLKMNHLVDLKSFSNMQGKPVQRAIDMAISNYKYFLPVVVYLEAIAAAKAMVRESKTKSINIGEGYDGYTKAKYDALVQWCWDWAHQPEPEVLFVFQQTGIAPVTRGRIMGKTSTFTITDFAVQYLKRKWVRCAEAFGTDPWIDVEPIVATEDESMTWAATDFGETE